MNKRGLIALICSAALMLCLVGCGEKSDGTNADEASVNDSQTTASAEKQDKEIVEFENANDAIKIIDKGVLVDYDGFNYGWLIVENISDVPVAVNLTDIVAYNREGNVDDDDDLHTTGRNCIAPHKQGLLKICLGLDSYHGVVDYDYTLVCDNLGESYTSAADIIDCEVTLEGNTATVKYINNKFTGGPDNSLDMVYLDCIFMKGDEVVGLECPVVHCDANPEGEDVPWVEEIESVGETPTSAIVLPFGSDFQI